tara:strand:- start:67 stop:423 length:357 start_codon:yes stop_codon:yes gene_type:complete
MQGENYLYFGTPVDEPNAADEAIMIPAANVLGFSPGALLVPGLNKTTMYFKGTANTGVTRGTVVLTHTSGKFNEVVTDIVSSINQTVSDGFVNVFNGFQTDIPNASSHITSIVIDSEV